MKLPIFLHSTGWRWVFCLTLIGSALLGTQALAQTNTAQTDTQNNPKVLLQTSVGDIVIELYPKAAPKTVTNFLRYVREQHYDGTIFHRVIPGFMVQAGGMDKGMKEKPTHAAIEHEGAKALASGLKNQIGYVAMARTSDPNSATAQFFINVENNISLDPTPIPEGDPVKTFVYGGKTYTDVPRQNLLNAPQLAGYTVFGKVISGMNVVNRIESVATTSVGQHQNVPQTPIVILHAKIVNPR